MSLIRRPSPVVLPPETCIELLKRESLGRVAITSHALPAVVPVRYGYLGGCVIFLTTKGSTLASATKNNVVAFEVDHSDDDAFSGWSVMIQGISKEIVDPDELKDAGGLGLTSWLAEGAGDHLVRIRPDFVTGRACGPIVIGTRQHPSWDLDTMGSGDSFRE
jgi:uncharacterized protein